MYVSSPSRNTSARKPSHFGSNSQPSPVGSASAAFASIGSRGGWNGSRITPTVAEASAERAAEEVREPDRDRGDDQAGQEVRDADLPQLEQPQRHPEQDRSTDRRRHQDRPVVEHALEQDREAGEAALDDEDRER